MVGNNQGFQNTAGKNLWKDPTKYPRKYPKFHIRQWDAATANSAQYIIGNFNSLINYE